MIDRTTATLSLDRKYFHISYYGQRFSIELPCEVSGDRGLDIPARKDNEVTFRLQVSDSVELASRFADVESPFPIDSLSLKSEIACNSCKSVITKGSIGIWRDLPRENWADMMDFWHCHRPDESQIRAVSVASKEYEVSDRSFVRKGLGLADRCHLIVSEDDCSNIKVSNE